jgi:arylsulfatase A-like enzyme
MHYQPGDSATPELSDVQALAPDYYEAFLGDMKLAVPDDYAYVMAQYDGEISYVDAQIGRLLDGLKARNLWDDTLIILLSDHGECFGEGDVYFDHHGLYDAVLRVALLCRVPGTMGSICKTMISTEDIVPSLCEILGWQKPDTLTGVSFADYLRGHNAPLRDFLVGIESTRQASICWRTENWKLIQPIVQDARGELILDIYGRQRDVSPLLFDLKTDAGEERNVAAQFPQVRDDLVRCLNDWRAHEVANRNGDDPLLDGLSLPFNDFMARLTSRRLREGQA